jgi:hypothetical protein
VNELMLAAVTARTWQRRGIYVDRRGLRGDDAPERLLSRLILFFIALALFLAAMLLDFVLYLFSSSTSSSIGGS